MDENSKYGQGSKSDSLNNPKRRLAKGGFTATQPLASGDLAFDRLVTDALRRSKGARIDQLRKLLIETDREEAESHAGRLFALKIWWPLVGSFHGLVPEFEFRDHNDKQRFVDFAYFAGSIKVAIELDGFGPHAREISRWGFSDERRRQNFLIDNDWYVLRFSYDDVAESPQICRQTLLRMFGKRHISTGLSAVAADDAWISLKPVQREIVRLARGCEVLSAKRIKDELGISKRTVTVHLQMMRSMGILVPAHAGTKRPRGFRLTQSYRM